LRVGRDDRPECQEQGGGKTSSNVLHCNDLRKCRYWTCTRTARAADRAWRACWAGRHA
jgi:hypothetical protein